MVMNDRSLPTKKKHNKYTLNLTYYVPQHFKSCS